MKSICVYCGSNFGNDDKFSKDASLLGKTIAEAGLNLVYGGGGRGLMGVVAQSALDAGGYVTGIIPDFLVEKEHMLDGVSEVIVTDNMHERKWAMFKRSDAFVTLPGGIGTLEELVEQLTWVQLNRHQKPIALVNTGNYWNPLLALLDEMRDYGFLEQDTAQTLIATDGAEAVRLLQEL